MLWNRALLVSTAMTETVHAAMRYLDLLSS